MPEYVKVQMKPLIICHVYPQFRPNLLVAHKFYEVFFSSFRLVMQNSGSNKIQFGVDFKLNTSFLRQKRIFSSLAWIGKRWLGLMKMESQAVNKSQIDLLLRFFLFILLNCARRRRRMWWVREKGVHLGRSENEWQNHFPIEKGLI